MPKTITNKTIPQVKASSEYGPIPWILQGRPPWFQSFALNIALIWAVIAAFLFAIPASIDLWNKVFPPSSPITYSIVVNPHLYVRYETYLADTNYSTKEFSPQELSQVGIEILPTITVTGLPNRPITVKAFLEFVDGPEQTGAQPSKQDPVSPTSEDPTFSDNRPVAPIWIPIPIAFYGKVRVHVQLFIDNNTVRIGTALSDVIVLDRPPIVTADPTVTVTLQPTIIVSATHTPISDSPTVTTSVTSLPTIATPQNLPTETPTIVATLTSAPSNTPVVDSDLVIVPDVIDEDVRDAVKELVNAGLTVPNPGPAVNSRGVFYVTKTNPAPGTQVQRGTPIRLSTGFDCTSPRCP